MKLINLFTREEPIAGLEVSDSHLRLALVAPARKKKTEKKQLLELQVLAEEKLAAGVVDRGVLKDKARFGTALNNLLKKAGPSLRYAIVSLPADAVYSHVFGFPQTIRGERLEESMKLTVGFQLPVKPEDVYLDWEKVESQDMNEIFLAAAPKPVVNAYLEAFRTTRLKVVAVEFHPLSLSRSAVMPKDTPVMYVVSGDTSTSLFVLKNRVLRFADTLPADRTAPDMLAGEVRKIKDFYTAEYEPLTQTVDLPEGRLSDEFKEAAEGGTGKWLISVGAAARGLIPRSDDQVISLMPIGTEEAYEYQKAAVFAELLSNLTVGIAVFFGVAFIGSWLLLRTIQENLNQQLELMATLQIPPDAVLLEQRAKNLNDLLAQTGVLLERMPRWSIALEDVRSVITKGITVTAISLPAPDGEVTLTGIAGTRAQLNEFRKALESAAAFTGAKIPLAGLEQRENISFTATFGLKEPGKLFNY